MKKPPNLNDDERAELVAFLDGELTGDAARAVEARINVDPGYRAEADSLKRAWEMLDFLPKSEPMPSFTERTLSKLTPTSSGRNRRPPPLPGERAWWFWPAAAGGWSVAFSLVIGLGYRGYGWAVPREPSEADLVRDLRLIENKKAYDNVEDLKFLERLNHPDLFGDDAGGS
jgi:anti-sigma factor RsiW